MDYSEDYNAMQHNENKFYDNDLCDSCQRDQVEVGETLCDDCARIIGE